MKEIELTQGKTAMVDDGDYEWLNQWKWYANKKGKTWYAVTHPHKKEDPIFMHRLILNTPRGMLTDHKDGNGLNNQRDNIRICNYTQNNCNRNVRESNTGYIGVTYYKQGRYIRARIKVNKKEVNLGSFKTAEDAAIAYDEAALKYHGEFANLNFP